MQHDTSPTRGAALDLLARRAPLLGRVYAARRNTDPGPDAAPTTSQLSPWLRRRLILERELVDAAIDAHGAEAAEKFVEEVLWRTYFKGYLETHPRIWTDYQALLAQARAGLERVPAASRGFDDATAGRTGIEGFDDWARELVQTGWLHNHARMWFASIWIHTLRLPWVLGADFFLRHLLDGDPASNTLSWRWVGGLHTRGKTYAARAENIRRCTDGRFAPRGLNETPQPLEEADPAPLRLAPAAPPAPAGAVALLLHLDDLHPESLPLGGARVERVAAMVAHAPGASEQVRQFDAAAIADALERAAAHFGCPAVTHATGWAEGLPVVSAWAPVGPSADALPAGSARVLRAWDARVWPRSTRGYFQVKAAIPAILGRD